MGSGFRLDKKGVGEVLRTQCAPAVNDVAEQIARNARSIIDYDEIDVDVAHYRTDRQAASIVIADPDGLELQARSGVLTKAAAAAGLEVTSR